MKIKSLVKQAIAATTISATAICAQATVTDIGAVVPGIPTTFVGSTLGAPTTGFLDFFAFSLPSNSGSGYGVINLPISGLGVDSSLTRAGLLNNPDGNTSGLNGDEGVALIIKASAGNAVNFTFGPTPSGNYWLVVQGFTTGTTGGAYAGSISVTAPVTPVPEPESYAMLLAGLGVMGAIAIRRNKSKSD